MAIMQNVRLRNSVHRNEDKTLTKNKERALTKWSNPQQQHHCWEEEEVEVVVDVEAETTRTIEEKERVQNRSPGR